MGLVILLVIIARPAAEMTFWNHLLIDLVAYQYAFEPGYIIELNNITKK